MKNKNFFLVGLVFFILSTIVIYPGYRERFASPTGDEPSYIVMMESLVRDHDINVINNYQNSENKWVVKDQMHLVTTSEGKIFSLHRWGLPFLLCIFYAIGGYLGVVVALNIIGIFSIFSITKYIIKNKESPYKAFIFPILLFLTPFFVFSTQIYPETLCFFIVSMLITFVDNKFESIRKVIYGCLIIYFSAFIHEKFAILIVPLVWLIVYKKDFRLFFIGSFIAFCFYVLTIFALYGFDFLSFLKSGGLNMLSAKNIPRNVLLLLFDQRSGILWFFPLVLYTTFIFKDSLKITPLLILPFLYLVLIFVEAYGGFVPPGRYLYPIYPIIFIGIGNYLMAKKKISYESVIFIPAATILIGYVVLPSIVYPFMTIPNGYLFYLLGIDNASYFNRLLPAFDLKYPPLSWETILVMLKCVLPLVLLTSWVFYRNKNILNGDS